MEDNHKIGTSKKRETADQRLDRMLEFDRQYLADGCALAGMDEVGRGPLAGPVVVCCILLPTEFELLGVNDSKKVSAKRREALSNILRDAAIDYGIGMCSEREIDEYNILNATRIAFRRAYAAVEHKIDRVLIDAVSGLDLPTEQILITHGDAQSFRIACASIVAKVMRDELMVAYDEQFPQYGFAQHKGYGTAAHIEAIKKFGPCEIHRKSFIKKWV